MCNLSLKFLATDNGTSTQCENIYSYIFHTDMILVVFIVPQSWKFGIDVEVKFQASVWLERESVSLESLKVPTYVFNWLFRTWSRDVTEPSALIYRKLHLRVCIQTEIHENSYNKFVVSLFLAMGSVGIDSKWSNLFGILKCYIKTFRLPPKSCW